MIKFGSQQNKKLPKTGLRSSLNTYNAKNPNNNLLKPSDKIGLILQNNIYLSTQ